MPRAKKRGSKFTGELARPIEEKKAIWALDKSKWEEAAARERAEIHERRLEKVKLLAKHYGLTVEASDETESLISFWGQLALYLAIDFVPGFQVKKQRIPNTLLDTVIEVHDWAKKNKKPFNEFRSCLSLVKQMPHLKIGTEKSTDRQKANILCNKLSARRAVIKKQKRLISHLH